MIYITGDTHGDLGRFSHKMFRKIKKRDTLIICGDFGFIWNGESDKKEKRLLKWLGKRRYDVLFADGAHENFDELEKYPTEDWNGGKTRKISGKLRQLMRGHVFEIDGKRILAFGGGERAYIDGDVNKNEENSVFSSEGESGDNDSPVEKCSPSSKDFEQAMKSLEKVNFKVDYIISYEPPTQLTEFLSLDGHNSDTLSYFLDEINRKTEYKRWFFGRHHINKIVPPKYFAMFDDVINAEYNPASRR
jgi:hypothetical protein